MAKSPRKGKLTYKEKRDRERAWLRQADEVLATYGEPKEVKPDEDPPTAA